MAKRADKFRWLFHRMGGLDQVEFRKGDDICRLRELDPKLWVALSCPAKGLEFDARTLALIDTDHDGRIRIPEVIEAAEWVCDRLKDPGVLLEPADAMPLDVIDDSTPQGKRLTATAETILANLGKGGADAILPADVAQAVLHASEQMFNGDGILPPLEELDEDMRGYIQNAVAVSGGIEDAGGAVGIDTAISDAFIASLSQWREWNAHVAKAETPLGKDTPEAWQLVTELKGKIDDYFMRCELVAYAPSAQNALNLEDHSLTDATGLLEPHALAELPLAKAGPEQPLDLARGLNPAWREKVERLAQLVRPLLAAPGTLTRDDWTAVQKVIAPFSEAVAEKPSPTKAATATVEPTQSIDSLGEERVEAILAGGYGERFAELARQDKDGPAASTDIADMERLVLYYRHFRRLLVNFVNFKEFYDLDSKASFQSGTLYIDGRACHLCMPAGDVEAHSALAEGSHIFLLYCECTRRKSGAADPEKLNIVAAVTAGDSDLLVPNRNGIYVDSRGEDWDARVVKVMSNPIGVWQAVWSPYKKLGGLITDQISKYASDKQAGLMASASKKLDEVGGQVATGAAPRFDIGRNVGIFAAVGLALGAIGTAVGSIANAIIAMEWWQLPLLLLGILALVSGPSMLMAWLKLRQRTLGPLLEASGWAINGRASLSYGVARRLSSVAALPPGSARSELDPLAQMQRLRRKLFWLGVAAGVAAVLGWLLVKEHRAGKTAPASAPAVVQPAESGESTVTEQETPPAQ